MSPDDPRYGRPTAYSASQAAPAYSDRGPAPIYSDRGPPQGADFPIARVRLWTADGAPTGALDLQAPGTAQGANGRSVMAALPPEDQPETGPRQELPERLRRQEVAFATRSRRAPSSSIRRTPSFITFSAAAVRSATASASAARASPGPGCRRSPARRSGRIGIRPRR
jgi:hypothetical protein